MYVNPTSRRFWRGRLTPAIRANSFLPQPCRCLCLGFVQMTSTLPCRLITRQRSHIGLTDALTFMRRCGKPRLRHGPAATVNRTRRRPDAALNADARGGQDAGPLVGHRDRVLEVRGERIVARVDRPAVVPGVDAGPARGDHRLDGERHPRLEERTATRLAEVRDLRLLVHGPPHPVAHELADDGEA